MTDKIVLLRFHSRRMLLTVDLNTLFEQLFDAFGEDVAITVTRMSDAHREKAEDMSGPITNVRTRFTIEDFSDPASPLRREDIEERVVRLGRK